MLSLAAWISNTIFFTAVALEVFCMCRVSVKVSPACTVSGLVENPVTMTRGVEDLPSAEIPVVPTTFT